MGDQRTRLISIFLSILLVLAMALRWLGVFDCSHPILTPLVSATAFSLVFIVGAAFWRLPTFFLFLVGIGFVALWSSIPPSEVAVSLANSALSTTNVILLFTGAFLGLALRQGIADKLNAELDREERPAVELLYAVLCPVQNFTACLHLLELKNFFFKLLRFVASTLITVVVTFLSTVLGVQVLKSLFSVDSDVTNCMGASDSHESADEARRRLFGIGCLSVVGSCVLVFSIPWLPNSTYWLFTTSLGEEADWTSKLPWGLLVFGLLTAVHGHCLLRACEPKVQSVQSLEGRRRFYRPGYLVVVSGVASLGILWALSGTIPIPLLGEQQMLGSDWLTSGEGKDASLDRIGQAQILITVLFSLCVGLLLAQLLFRGVFSLLESRMFSRSERSGFLSISLWNPLREGADRVFLFLMVFVVIIAFRSIAKTPMDQLVSLAGLSPGVLLGLIAGVLFGAITGSMFGCIAVAMIFMPLNGDNSFLAIQLMSIVAANIDHLHPFSFSVTELLRRSRSDDRPHDPRSVWNHYIYPTKTELPLLRSRSIRSIHIQIAISLIGAIVAAVQHSFF